MKFDYLTESEYGYLKLNDYKNQEEIDDYFENEYYQNATGSYNLNYSKKELDFFKRKMEQKEYIIKKYLPKKEEYTLLDVGCGEGKTLKYFKEKGYKVFGVDKSEFGIKHNNPDLMDSFFKGDCKKVLPKLVEEGRKFDIICTDMMLDMTPNPEEVGKYFKPLLKEDGVIWMNTSNNYSMLQMKLLEDGMVSKDHWLDREGHPSYFNTKALKIFGQKMGLELCDIYGESFIDLNLVNNLTNYYEKENIGHDCYEARIYLESLMMDISMEKFVEISRLLGEMGFGRTVTGIFKVKL